MKEIEFWFSIGSTYSYLSVTRLPQVARETGASFSWQPFSVRSIMREMDNVPFPPSKQAKVDYMWRDIERRAKGYGFAANVPAPYPLQDSIWLTGLQCWPCTKAGVKTMCRPLIGAGLSMVLKQAVSPIFRNPWPK